MCGICGFTGNGDQSILEAMMEAMVYRGPDAAGYKRLKSFINLRKIIYSLFANLQMKSFNRPTKVMQISKSTS